MKFKLRNTINSLGLYLSLVVMLSVSIMPLKVLAVDTNFYSANDILFYNPDEIDCPTTDSSSLTDSTASDAGYKQRLETTLKFLTGKGLSLAAAAGIAGNLKAESGIEPGKIQGFYNSVASDNYSPVNGVGFGIAQWTFTSRQSKLVAYAKKENKKITDLTMQLEFLWSEAISSYKPMLIKLNTIKSGQPYNGIDPTIAAAIIFHGKTTKAMLNTTVRKVNPVRGFEASADTGDRIVNNRGGNATKMYNDYKDSISDGSGVSGILATDSTDTESSEDTLSRCGNGVSTDSIVSTALSFALSKPAVNGQNKKTDANPTYITALNNYNKNAYWADCGIFVATVMRASGIDPQYPKSGTSIQLGYLKNSTDKYQVIEKPNKNNLQAGDILIVNNGTAHHTMIYTGQSPYPVVDASLEERVPSVRNVASLNYMLGLSGVIAARIISD